MGRRPSRSTAGSGRESASLIPAPESHLDLGRYAGDALIAIDFSGRVLSMNPAAEQLFGCSSAELGERTCSDLIQASLCAGGCPLETVRADGLPVTRFDVNIRTAGDQPMRVCIVASPLRNAHGETVGMVESIRDIRHIKRLLEERESALARMEASASWLSAIVNTVNDALIATDCNLRITSFNRAAEVLTGYCREEVEGLSCKEVFSSGYCPLEETLHSGSGLPGMDLQMRIKGGRAAPVWLRTEVLRNAGDTVVGAVGIFRERTEMRPAPAQLRGRYTPLVGESAAMQEVYGWIDRLAPTDTTVLLCGESGTGKELVAELLHYRSRRSHKPLIKVNCAALPETLLESELFGHVRGAFTGAVTDRPGRFELAHQGTLFLDEIGDLPLPLQAKLLRVLQDRSVERLGSGRPVPIDLRIIAATNRNLPRMIAEQRFREDLYYRLAVVPLTLPPLRDHREDIPALASGILCKLAGRRNSVPTSLSAAAVEALERHSWPGNVRELENALEYASIRAGSTGIELADLPPYLGSSGRRAPDGERDRIELALRRHATVEAAAQELGVARATLFRRMRALGIRSQQGSLTRRPAKSHR